MQQDNDRVDETGGQNGDAAFSVVLRPYRSLGPTGFFIVMGIVCTVSFSAGIVFLAMGAWPIVGFFGLDMLLVYWAFKASYLSARAQERIELKGGQLLVARRDAAGREAGSWAFEPYWVRLELEELPPGDNRLTLTSHGRRLTIAAMLGSQERAAFASVLGRALAAYKTR